MKRRIIWRKANLLSFAYNRVISKETGFALYSSVDGCWATGCNCRDRGSLGGFARCLLRFGDTLRLRKSLSDWITQLGLWQRMGERSHSSPNVTIEVVSYYDPRMQPQICVRFLNHVHNFKQSFSTDQLIKQSDEHRIVLANVAPL